MRRRLLGYILLAPGAAGVLAFFGIILYTNFWAVLGGLALAAVIVATVQGIIILSE